MKDDKLYEAYQKVITESSVEGNFQNASGNLDKVWKEIRTKHPDIWKQVAKDTQKIDGLINDVWTKISKQL